MANSVDPIGAVWDRSCKNVTYTICKQQRCRSACAFAQSDQHLCCLLLRKYDMYTCSIQSFKVLASFCRPAHLLFAAWIIWTASSEFGTYRLCEQRRFRRACASGQSRQNLRCSLIQAVSQEEPSDRKPDHWPL